MKKIVILHIFSDEKFFDGVSVFFDSLKNVENLYYYYTPDKNISFKYIHLKNKVKIINNFHEYTQILFSHQIDIIYFQSLPTIFYRYFKYINPRTILFWWCFGFEIYYAQRLIPPLIRIDLFKQLTSEFRRNHAKTTQLKKCIRLIYWFLRLPIDYWTRKKILERVDFFSPVLPIEYILMKNNKTFKAQPFMFKEGPGLIEKNKFSYFSKAQNVLIGNSLTYTNNHLDIFNTIRSYKLVNQRYIIPINYGNDYCGNSGTLKKLSGLSVENTIWLENFLSLEEYNKLISTVSHAIFGHMRQQAMGNINTCLLSGVKIFLYKDSLLFKQLKDFGYIIFSIEDDLTEDALKMPLPKEDAYKNYSIKLALSINKVKDTENELSAIVKRHKLSEL